MLSNRNSKSSIGGDDPFNKAKLAEEAKRYKEQAEEAKRQQQKSKLQLQINNLERELDRFVIDLRAKENLLTGVKRKLEEAEKSVFLLGGQIKKQEGGLEYLNNEVLSTGSKTGMAEAELEKARTAVTLAEREQAILESEYHRNEAELSDLELKISRLREELDRLVIESDLLKKKLIKNEADINLKKNERAKLAQVSKSLETGSKQAAFEKSKVAKNAQAEVGDVKEKKQQLFLQKRVVEQLEKDSKSMAQDLARLTREKEVKEREIAKLKVDMSRA